MHQAVSRTLTAIVVATLTLGATPAYKREKKDNIATFEALAAAHFLACPQLFGEQSVSRYLGAMSPRSFADYRRAAEFDPQRRAAILESTRQEIRERSEKTFRSDRTYTLKNVQFIAGTYDVARKGFEFRFARSVVVWVQQPGPRDYLFSWAELRGGAELPPASVLVFPEYPQESPLSQDNANLDFFVPVEPSVAEDFAAAYPASRRNNLDNDGRRKALAYLDIKVTGCKDADPRVTFERGVTAQVVGMRIYAMSAYDLSAQGLVFEWPVRK